MFVLKPHIVGPEGKITTPDVIVDCLFVDRARRSTAVLTHQCWPQAGHALTCAAGYAVMALGGGALILPALVVSDGLTIIARTAWRLNNLDRHIGQVTLNGAPLAQSGLPSAEIEAAGGTGDALPRGFLLVRTQPGDTVQAVLADRVMDRTLSHRVSLERLDADRWDGERPRPRYSVGPTQKDVPHYI